MVSKATNISKEEVSTVSRRKSMFSRLRFRKRNKKAANEDVREGSVDPVVNEPKRVEAPPTRSSKIPMQVYTPPEAEAAAFQGTPRYDWMDIETAAAVKVQSAFRRNKVMNKLMAQNKSTAAIRRRQMQRASGDYEPTSSLMDCCGVSMIFEEEVDKREQDRQEFEQRRHERMAKEAALRDEYAKMKKDTEVREAYEVVEDEDEQ